MEKQDIDIIEKDYEEIATKLEAEGFKRNNKPHNHLVDVEKRIHVVHHSAISYRILFSANNVAELIHTTIAIINGDKYDLELDLLFDLGEYLSNEKRIEVVRKLLALDFDNPDWDLDYIDILKSILDDTSERKRDYLDVYFDNK